MDNSSRAGWLYGSPLKPPLYNLNLDDPAKTDQFGSKRDCRQLLSDSFVFKRGSVHIWPSCGRPSFFKHIRTLSSVNQVFKSRRGVFECGRPAYFKGLF